MSLSRRLQHKGGWQGGFLAAERGDAGHMITSVLGTRLSWHFADGWVFEPAIVRFAALPAWLAKDMTVYLGDNQDAAFTEKIRELISRGPDWPRRILNDDGYFRVI
jgi:hypothetical protein